MSAFSESELDAIHEPTPLIRFHPERIVSWGIESE
jgi:hypothetical protein